MPNKRKEIDNLNSITSMKQRSYWLRVKNDRLHDRLFYTLVKNHFRDHLDYDVLSLSNSTKVVTPKYLKIINRREKEAFTNYKASQILAFLVNRILTYIEREGHLTKLEFDDLSLRSNVIVIEDYRSYKTFLNFFHQLYNRDTFENYVQKAKREILNRRYVASKVIDGVESYIISTTEGSFNYINHINMIDGVEQMMDYSDGLYRVLKNTPQYTQDLVIALTEQLFSQLCVRAFTQAEDLDLNPVLPLQEYSRVFPLLLDAKTNLENLDPKTQWSLLKLSYNLLACVETTKPDAEQEMIAKFTKMQSITGLRLRKVKRQLYQQLQLYIPSHILMTKLYCSFIDTMTLNYIRKYYQELLKTKIVNKPLKDLPITPIDFTTNYLKYIEL